MPHPDITTIADIVRVHAADRPDAVGPPCRLASTRSMSKTADSLRTPSNRFRASRAAGSRSAASKKRE